MVRTRVAGEHTSNNIMQAPLTRPCLPSRVCACPPTGRAAGAPLRGADGSRRPTRSEATAAACALRASHTTARTPLTHAGSIGRHDSQALRAAEVVALPDVRCRVGQDDARVVLTVDGRERGGREGWPCRVRWRERNDDDPRMPSERAFATNSVKVPRGGKAKTHSLCMIQQLQRDRPQSGGARASAPSAGGSG